MRRGLFARTAGAAIVAASCSTAILDVRQPVRPAPSVDCLTTALESSEDVALVRRTFYHYGYSTTDFAVYDSTATADPELRLKAGQRLAQLGRHGDDPAGERTPGDTVILQFTWNGDQTLPGADVSALTAVAVRVLRHVQQRCAPQESTVPVCALEGRAIPC